MAINVVTYLMDDHGKPKGIMSNLLFKLCSHKIIKPIDNRAIRTIDTNKLVGAFYSIDGPKPVVDFLSWATNSPFHKKGNNLQNIETDPNGNIRKCERLGV